MAKSTKIRKSKEERIAEIERRIQTHKANIAALETKKDLILNPKPRKHKATIKNIISIAKAQGLTEQEIADKLGVAAEFE